MEFIYKINWIDLFISLIIVRSFLVGIKNGFAVEFFKFLGIIVSIFISFQFYLNLADFLRDYLPLKAKLLENISFLVLVAVSYIIVVLLRSFFVMIFKFESTGVIDKILGFIVGFIRGALLASLILAFFILINTDYFHKSINKSLVGLRVLTLSNKTYSFIFEKIIKNILPHEEKKNEIISTL
ncbi:MAG: CvpA family protein [Candidatus Omnitrophota bacterium]